MASRRPGSPSAAHRAALDGVEAWYCEAALTRGHLDRIGRYAALLTAAEDRAAAGLIVTEAAEGLARMERFVAAWRAFWEGVYLGRGVSEC